MSNANDSLILTYLRRIDIKLDRLVNDVHVLKVRMTAVEEGLAGVHRRMDRAEVRLDGLCG